MTAPDDLTKLSSLDPESIEAALKSRYAEDKIYTNINSLLVALNPYKAIDGIYSEEKLASFTQYASLPPEPHVYAVAADAYRGLLGSHSQTLIISGESGAGKTETSKIILQFLARAATSSTSSTSSAGLEGRIVASTPVLEAFGNAKTLLNDNSSRYGKFLLLQFNHSGKLQGARMSTYLLEKSRVVSQAAGERNYHSFYCVCASPLAAELQLADANAYAILGKGSAQPKADAALFAETESALGSAGFTATERKSTWQLLAAALHMGNLDFGEGGKSQPDADAKVDKAKDLELIAKLLGCPKDEMLFCLTKRKIKAGREFVTTPCSVSQADSLREGVVKALYARLFDWVVERVNVSLALNGGDGTGSKERAAFFIGILDIFGFEHFEHNSLEQLCINFTNEKLQARFNEAVFASAAEENAVEGVPTDDADTSAFDNADVLTLIEAYPTGILAMINEECVVPQGSDATLHEKLVKQHMASTRFKKVLKQKDRFEVVHYAGNVAYSSTGMLGKNKDSVNEDMIVLLQASTDEFTRGVFADPPEAAALAARKRGSKFQGVVAKFSRQLTDLTHILDSSDMHFVRCIKTNMGKAPGVWESDSVMRQLRSSGVLEVVRVFGMGYPDRVPHSEIVSRYGCCLPREKLRNQVDAPGVSDKEASGIVLGELLKAGEFAIGITKAFLKSGVLASLRLKREALVATKASFIQARLRGMLSRTKWRETAQQLLDRKAMERAEKKRLEEEAERAREEEAALAQLKASEAKKARDALAKEKAAAAKELARRKAEEEKYEREFKAQQALQAADESAATLPTGAMSGLALAPPPAKGGSNAAKVTALTKQFKTMPKDTIEYALYLGMDPTVDKDLLWIADEALKAGTPEGWVEMLDQRGLLYFYNETTGETSRQHPLAEHYQALFFKLKLEQKGGGEKKGKKDAKGAELTPASVHASFARQNTFSIELGPHTTSMSNALKLKTPRSAQLVPATFGIDKAGTDVRELLVSPARWDGSGAPQMFDTVVSKETVGLFERHALTMILSENYRAFAFAATRHSTSKLTEYAVSLDEVANSQGGTFAGRLRTNQQAREWVLYGDHDDAYGLKTGIPRAELGLIVYKKRLLGPIQVELAIPRVSSEEGGKPAVFAPRTPEETMLQQYKAGRLGSMLVLKCSIVVQPGAGAVELIADEKPLAGTIVFRAVKNVNGTWTMAYAHPLSTLQAFSFLLTIIANPLTCVLDVPPRYDRGGIFGSDWLTKQPAAELAAVPGKGIPQIVNSATLGWLSEGNLAVYSLAIIENDVFVGMFSGDIRVWHTDRYKALVGTESKPEHDTLKGHTAAVCAMLVDNGKLISASEDKSIIIWDLTTLKPKGTLTGHRLGLRCLALSGSTLIAAGHDASIYVWDTKATALVKTIETAHLNWIRGVKVYKGSVCVTCSRDKLVKLWDFKDWRLMGTLNASSDVYAVDVGDDLVYAACADAKIRVWNVHTLARQHVLIGHTGVVRALHLEPATKTLYSVSEDKKVKVWDLKSETCATLFGHVRFIRALAYNNQTKKLYSGGDDARVRVWEAARAPL